MAWSSRFLARHRAPASLAPIALGAMLFFQACGTPAPASPTAAPAGQATRPAATAPAGATAAPANSLPAAKAATGEPYKIGVVVPRTGQGATLGDLEYKGVQLAAETLNANGGIGGRPVQLVINDDETNPEKSVELTKNLIQRDKVVAIIGSGISANCFAMDPVVKEFKTPMYCMSPVPEPKQGDYQFVALWDAPRWLGRLPVAYLKSVGVTKIAQIATTDTSGKLNVGWIEAAAKDLGVTLVDTEYFNPNDVDVTAPLTKIKDAQPQGMYIGGSGAPGVTAIKGMKLLGLNIPAYTGSANASYAFAKLVGDVQNIVTGGAKIHIWQQLPDSDPNKAAVRAFAQAYEKKYNEKADLYAAVASDGLNIMAQAISSAGTDGTKIVNYLENDFTGYKGVATDYGNMKDHRGTSKAPGIIVRYDNGNFKLEKIMENY